MLQTLPAELLSIILLIICYVMMLMFFKLGKISGLYIYIILAMIVANLQVLKATYFSGYIEPVALGTVVYSTSFLASDLINEFYGPSAARQAIYLSFTSSLFVLMTMLCTIGFAPLNVEVNHEHYHFDQAHQAIEILFTPAPAILISSLIAYAASQLIDIAIYTKIRELTENKYIWLRVLCSVLFAALLDSIIFNVCAWKIFNNIDISWSTIFYSYVLGNYIFQIIIAIINIPIFYIFKKLN